MLDLESEMMSRFEISRLSPFPDDKSFRVSWVCLVSVGLRDLESRDATKNQKSGAPCALLRLVTTTLLFAVGIVVLIDLAMNEWGNLWKESWFF
jgi:hypothetical protein